MTESKNSEVREEEKAISFAEFLETTPPSTLSNVTGMVRPVKGSGGGIVSLYLNHPEIQLHCPNDICNGIRIYRRSDKGSIEVPADDFTFRFISYICSNCQNTKKVFSLAAKSNADGTLGECYKFGELPVYGPPTPARLITLIGPDREVFLKGRRCENQGLGIGAFVYYRRVVESQKNRILDEMIKVSRTLSVPEEKIQRLEAAKSEVQFSKAVASVKDAIPESLLINGHNPLTLLHAALSDGLHERSDEHCLELANSIRVILGELSDRLAQALKDEAELNSAISRLLKRP